jgi:hypothetical protein
MKVVFKARPHPGLLHLKKERRKNIPGFTGGFPTDSAVCNAATVFWNRYRERGFNLWW